MYSEQKSITSKDQGLFIHELKQILGSIIEVLKRDGFIIYIGGPKDKGKTNLSLLLAEVCYLAGFRKRITTNIKVESYMFENQITDYETLDAWLKTKGRKLFILDEAGKHIKRARHMSSKNVNIMDTLQLIRHYDAGFIGIAPSERFIDSKFLDTDILDVRIKKLTRKRAKIDNYLLNESYFLNEIPPTSLRYDSKDIATFTLKKVIPLDKLPLCCRVAQVYALEGSYQRVLDELPEIKDPKQIQRNIIQCIKKHH